MGPRSETLLGAAVFLDEGGRPPNLFAPEKPTPCYGASALAVRHCSVLLCFSTKAGGMTARLLEVSLHEGQPPLSRDGRPPNLFAPEKPAPCYGASQVSQTLTFKFAVVLLNPSQRGSSLPMRRGSVEGSCELEG